MFIEKKFQKTVVYFFVLFNILSFKIVPGAETIDFPKQENFKDNDEYLKKAEEFLKLNHDSKFAPRVALDAYLTLRNESQKSTEHFLSYLLFDYITSLQGVYYLSFYNDHNSFVDSIISNGYSRLRQENIRGFLQQFCQTAWIAYRHYGKKILKNDDYLLITYVLSSHIGSERIKKEFWPVIEKKLQKTKNQSEVRRARHIVLKTESEANAILKELKQGHDFAELAKEKSIGPSAKHGGDLGYFGRGNMIPEFENVVFNMQKGSISEPLKTAYGYHIIKLEDVKGNEKNNNPAVNKIPDNSTFQDILEICLSSELSLIDKITGLNSLRDKNSTSADFLIFSYYSQLNEKDRKDPELVNIMARLEFRRGSFPKALSLIELLPGEKQDDAEILFIKSMCYYSSGEDQKAIDILENIKNIGSGNKWVQTAEKCLNGITNFENYSDKTNNIIWQCIEHIKQNKSEVVEYNINYYPDNYAQDKERFSLYFGFNKNGNEIELDLLKNDKFILGAKNSEKICKIYFMKNPKIQIFNFESSCQPVFSLQLLKNRFIAGFGLKSHKEADSDKMLNIEYNSDDLKKKIKESFRALLIIPYNIDESRRFEFIKISQNNPAQSFSFIFEVIEDKKISGVSISGEKLLIEGRFKYDTTGSFILSQPEWPKYKTEENKMSGVEYYSWFLKEALKVFSELNLKEGLSSIIK